MNHTIIYPDFLLFWGTNQRSITEHQHPAVQWVIGVEKPFLTKNTKGNWVDCPNILVTPNHRHECDASGIEILTFMIDQESLLGEFVLQNTLAEQPWLTFPQTTITKFNLSELTQLIQHKEWGKIYQQVADFFGFQPNTSANLAKRDERIEDVLNYLKAHLQEEITTQTLTEISFLSESRLLHLFKAQVGLPIRNYILWLKIKTAVELIIAQQYNLTQIAYETGFADAAHMSRTFNKVLGVSPSMVSKNSKFVQVFLPEVV